MAIESVTCPNCGATGIQIDTTREHSFCSYCGSTVKTKDVLHLDMESMTLEKLKRNAHRSFEVGQYGNARADWVKATQLDRTDYESYWGIVRCDMATQPDDLIREAGHYGQALAYAPQDMKAEYMRQVEAHNTRIHQAQARARVAQEARDAEARAAQAAWDAGAREAHHARICEAEAEIARLKSLCKRLGTSLILCILALVIWLLLPNLMYAIGGVSAFTSFSSALPLGVFVFSSLIIVLFIAWRSKKKKAKESQNKLNAAH